MEYANKGSYKIRYYNNPSTIADIGTNALAEIDEIKNFVDSRFIYPHEAAWRIFFDFLIHYRNPPVQIIYLKPQYLLTNLTPLPDHLHCLFKVLVVHL